MPDSQPDKMMENSLQQLKGIVSGEGKFQGGDHNSQLYKHEKVASREKYGFINGTLLSDAYVIGTTRNTLLGIMW